MKNKFWIIVVLGVVFSISRTMCQSRVQPSSEYKIDTLYYDKNWRECPVAVFADYQRITITPKDSIYAKKFRTYYLSGGLQEEGDFLSMGNSNENFIRDGECTTYYKSGKIKEKAYFAHGVQNGEYTAYYENGLVEVNSYFVNGELEGIHTRFNEDGNECKQCEFLNGEFKNTYYTVISNNGYTMKFSLSDDSPILDTPMLHERKELYQDGVAWSYYVKNGITLFASAASVRDYGRYVQVIICLENNSPLTFYFDPCQIKAQFGLEKNKELDEAYMVPALSSAEYIKNVKRGQNWEEALAGLGVGLSAAAAGHSSATITTNAQVSYGGSTAFGSSRTRIAAYDGAAAFQAGIIAGNYIGNYATANQEARAARNEGYLKQTTIQPRDRIIGYINIPKVRATEILIRIPVNSINYDFTWGLSAKD